VSALAAACRAVAAAGLVALLIFGIPAAPAPGEPLLLSSETPPDTVAAILARDTAPILSWVDTVPPGRGVTSLLAAAAGQGGDVTLALPGRAGGIRVEAPDRPVAGRRAALRISIRAQPDSEAQVTVEGPGGGVDTLRIATGLDGRGAVSLGVEASREGAASWTVRSPAGTAVAHAWVRPASRVRVLVWGRAPNSESRYLVRALEAAGMEVAVLQGLGRGLTVASSDVAEPRTIDDLLNYDVIALMGSPSEAADALALRWARARGGGLLLAGGVASSSPLVRWAPSGPGAEQSAADVAWTGPAEIVPLSGAEIMIRATGLPDAGLPVAEVDGEAIAHLDYLGRGRLFTAAFQSWPWVMRAGLVAEHHAFWESVVEWLAGGLAGKTVMVAEPAVVGTRWEGRLEGEASSEVLLTRDTPGAAAPEALSTTNLRGATTGAAFVPTEAGAHRLRLSRDTIADPGPRPFGVVAVAPTEGVTWTAAARSIGRAGGRIASIGEAEARRRATEGEPSDIAPFQAAPAGVRSPDRRTGLSWLLFLGLGGLTVLGWALRRIQGLR